MGGSGSSMNMTGSGSMDMNMGGSGMDMGGGGDMPMPMPMMMYMMHMTFYQSNKFCVLFKDFNSDGSNGQYAGLLVFVFVFCVILEGLNYHRFVMIKKHGDQDVTMNFKLKITFSYFVTVFLAYCIMLVIMSFNEGAFVTIILGLTVGNTIFSYQKKKIEINEKKLAKMKAVTNTACQR